MTKKELENKKKAIQQILDCFAENSFLVPNRYIEYQQFTNQEGGYRLYSNERRDYISIDIYGAENSSTFSASKHTGTGEWIIGVRNILKIQSASKKIEEIYESLFAIYNEIHSINPDKNALKKIREEISKKKQEIVDIQKKINGLEKEIEDFKKIK